MHNNDEVEGVAGPERPGADVIALPQLERLPESAGEDAAGGFRGLDTRSSRLEALELVRASVELADRIERDAQDAVKDRLARIEEEARLRRVSLDEQEAELDHARRDLDAYRQEHERAQQELETRRQELETKRSELDQYRQQVVEAVQALQARAEADAAATVAAATARGEALVEQARGEAAQLMEAARTVAQQLAEATREDAKQLLAEASPATTASPPVPEAPAFPPEAQAEPVAEEPEPKPAAEDAAAPPDFTPPPVSVEDLATVSSLPRLGTLNPFRNR